MNLNQGDITLPLGASYDDFMALLYTILAEKMIDREIPDDLTGCCTVSWNMLPLLVDDDRPCGQPLVPEWDGGPAAFCMLHYKLALAEQERIRRMVLRGLPYGDHSSS